MRTLNPTPWNPKALGICQGVGSSSTRAGCLGFRGAKKEEWISQARGQKPYKVWGLGFRASDLVFRVRVGYILPA